MKNLIHEIHRRSLWQVLGIYLALCWIVLQVVDVLGSNFGLPDWVAPAALMLLLIGLPIVVATAFVQEGIASKGAAAPGDTSESSPDDASADDGVETATTPSAAEAPGRRHGFFTWKNALVGGGVAFALLGVLTAGYLFMRASGIGPAGTLVAQGVLEEGAEVVLAEFSSSDQDLADVVTGALRIDLMQSPTIRLVPRGELDAPLRRMGLDDDQRITADVAVELAEREGLGAVIQGEVGTAGSGYVLTASIVDAATGEPLAAFRETARSDDDLIDAIEGLSRDIRDKAGESLRTVQGGPGLRQVSTSSLEALRLYTRGEALESQIGDGALDFYERAVAVDPEFAMAYRKIGVILDNTGMRREDAVAALGRAYDLRANLPPAERYLAEAYFHSNVTGDLEGAIRGYELLLDMDPRNVTGLNNLSIWYQAQGRFDEAGELLVRAMAEEKYVSVYQNLASVRMDQGDPAAAFEALELGAQELPSGSDYLLVFQLAAALDARDEALTTQLSAALNERPLDGPNRARFQARLGMAGAIRGRFAAADRAWDEVGDEPVFLAHPMRLAGLRAAALHAMDDREGAVRLLLDAYAANRARLAVTDLAHGAWLPILIASGALTEARRVYEEWVATVPEDELGINGRYDRLYVEATLAAAEGPAEEAIRKFEYGALPCVGVCLRAAQVQQGLLHDAEGRLDEALGFYEEYLDGHAVWVRAWVDLQYLARVLERTAQIHDERGDSERARGYYQRFVDLWGDADEAVQPRVRAARSRLTQIGEVGP